MAKQTKNIEWLQDVIVGSAFILKGLKQLHGNEFGEGMTIQINQFLRDAKKVEDAVKSRIEV